MLGERRRWERWVLGGGGVSVSGRMQDLYPREGRARPGWPPEGLNAPIRLPDGLVAFLEVGGGIPVPDGAVAHSSVQRCPAGVL